MSGLKWVRMIRQNGERLYLDGRFEEFQTPPGLKTNLMSHQKTTVRAMLDLEHIRHVKLADILSDEDLDDEMIKNTIAETCAGVLSEKFGSGKTVEILALIVAKKVPRPIAEITSLPFPRKDYEKSNRYYRRRDLQRFIGFGFEVRKKYTRLVSSNLIFVGKSVIEQWKDAIQRFTNLKVFVVENYRKFKQFCQMFISDIAILGTYDIILVKNGNMSSKNFIKDIPAFKGTAIESIKNKPIITAIGLLSRTTCWARVIIDDFDTIHMPSSATVVPAIFTWFISGTKKAPGNKFTYPEDCSTFRKRVINYRPFYNSVLKNYTLFMLFNVANGDDYIEASVRAGKIKFYVYKFKNPNDQYMKLLGAMGADDALAVMEMLNGDAIETAAERAGIKSTNPADIFEQILKTKYAIYKHNVKIESYLDNEVKEFMRTLDLGENKEEDIKMFRKNVRVPGPLSELEESLLSCDTKLKQTYKEIVKSNKEQKERNGVAIKRVQSNIKSGECPICMNTIASSSSDDAFDDLDFGLELVDETDEKCAALILKCCGVILCSKCGIKGTKMARCGGDIRGSCPKCRRSISLARDMIFLDKNFDIEKLADDTVLEEPKKKEKNLDSPDEPKEQTKLDAIVNIIKGVDEFDNKQETHINIPSLLEGCVELPPPDPKRLKTVVFATFQETLVKIEKRLKEEKIKYLKLHGTAKKIARIVKKFETEFDVLLVNGAKYCAGLNLQFADQIIFTNKIIDTSTEAQLAGRLQRLGRKTGLIIHYVVYENEVSMLNQIHEMRYV